MPATVCPEVSKNTTTLICFNNTDWCDAPASAKPQAVQDPLYTQLGLNSYAKPNTPVCISGMQQSYTAESHSSTWLLAGMLDQMLQRLVEALDKDMP